MFNLAKVNLPARRLLLTFRNNGLTSKSVQLIHAHAVHTKQLSREQAGGCQISHMQINQWVIWWLKTCIQLPTDSFPGREPCHSCAISRAIDGLLNGPTRHWSRGPLTPHVPGQSLWSKWLLKDQCVGFSIIYSVAADYNPLLYFLFLRVKGETMVAVKCANK